MNFLMKLLSNKKYDSKSKKMGTVKDNNSELEKLISPAVEISDNVLIKGNKEKFEDFYFSKSITHEPKLYQFKIYLRVNAKKIKFEKVNFIHCVFDGCYFNECVFDTCDFTGCKFIGCNFHQCALVGSNFEYAIFERTMFESEILDIAPSQSNLKLKFARSLRMNFQQIGDSKSVNKAINIELEATRDYLWSSWTSGEKYYSEKYAGIKRLHQFIKWLNFKFFDLLWGNGEKGSRLIYVILIVVGFLSLYDWINIKHSENIYELGKSFGYAFAMFFGVEKSNNYSSFVLGSIALIRLILFAMLTAILIKRLGRR